MGWHQSVSNPRKVYNERHEQVCVCETREQAALIVDAVRAFVPTSTAGVNMEGAENRSKRASGGTKELEYAGFAIT